MTSDHKEGMQEGFAPESAIAASRRVELEIMQAKEDQERKAEELSRARDRFQSIFNHAGVGICVSDTRGCLKMVNPQALRILDSEEHVTLLFTDIVMPDVNGRKLVEEAVRRRPSLYVLYTTGYTRNAIVHNGVLDAGVQLISKPFTLDQLGSKVRDVLDSEL